MNKPVITAGGPSDTVRGLVRTGVQVVVSAVLALWPVQAVLDQAGVTVDSDAAIGVLVSLVMAVYWLAMTWLQKSEVVQSNPITSWVVALLMGGQNTPAYGDPAAKYSVVASDGTETPITEYLDGQFGA